MSSISRFSGSHEKARKAECPDILEQLLDALFSRKLSASQRKEIVHRDCSTRRTDEADKTIDEVGSMELAIEAIARKKGDADGYARGDADGYARGDADGYARGMAHGVIRLMQNMGADENAIVQQLMEQLRISEEKAREHIAQLDSQNEGTEMNPVAQRE